VHGLPFHWWRLRDGACDDLSVEGSD
jgi:hypothetical protein